MTPQSLAAFFAVEGPVLGASERALFAQAHPAGFILFARNCVDRSQLQKLCADLRACVEWACPILIDQEGGAVLRLKSPVWQSFDGPRPFGWKMEAQDPKALPDFDAMLDHMCRDLMEAGVDVNCVPCLDYLCDATHPFLRERIFSEDQVICDALADRMCDTLLKRGITPVIKHIPGHGRANADTHYNLPTVTTPRAELEATDFDAFRRICRKPYAPALMAMTAHVIYADLDPSLPATLSPAIIQGVIRDFIGFDGLLMCDDVSMKALDTYGPVEKRAILALQAGCDVALYCAGKLEDMDRLAQTLPILRQDSQCRLDVALARKNKLVA